MIYNVNNYVFEQDGILKQVEIYINGELADVEAPIKLDESLNSTEYINFANTEGNMLEFTVHNNGNFVGMPVEAYITGTHNGISCRVSLGKFIVYESEKINDVKTRLVCYDDMQKFNQNVADFYNNITYPITVRNLLIGLCNKCNVSHNIPNQFTNSGYTIKKKPSETNTISGYNLLSYINEITVGFWKINRQGQLVQYKLKSGNTLYPSNDLFPSSDLFLTNEVDYIYQAENNFKELKMSDYVVKDITKLVVRANDNDVGVIEGTGTNTYVVTNNILLYASTDSEIRPYVKAMLEDLKAIRIRPFEATTRSLPFIEVGDLVEINSLSDKAQGFILKRSTSLPSGLDEIICQCTETIDHSAQNDDSRRINGNIHELVSTIEEWRSEIFDTSTGLASQIKQNKDNIELRVEKKDYNSSEIMSMINLDTTGVTIKGDKIDLLGNATFKSLSQTSATGVTTIKGDSITTGSITASQIASNAITGDKIKASAITSDKINTGAIVADKISAKAITGAKIADGTIVDTNIKDGTITGAKLVDSTITNAKISNGTITGVKISDSTITNSKIADLTIESGKIKDGTITSAKIGDAAITTAKIKDGAITNAKIESLNATKITAGTMKADRISGGTLNFEDIIVSNLKAEKIGSGTFTGQNLYSNDVRTQKLTIIQSYNNIGVNSGYIGYTSSGMTIYTGSMALNLQVNNGKLKINSQDTLSGKLYINSGVTQLGYLQFKNGLLVGYGGSISFSRDY